MNGITIIDDFAHHPTAIAGTLKALHARYPGARLWAILEPRSNTLRRNVFQNELARSLAVADEVVVANVFKSESIPESERMDVAALVADVQKLGRRARIAARCRCNCADGSARNAAGRCRGHSFQWRLWRHLRKAATTSESNCRRRFGQPFAEGVRQGVSLSPRARLALVFLWLRRARDHAGESTEFPALVARPGAIRRFVGQPHRTSGRSQDSSRSGRIRTRSATAGLERPLSGARFFPVRELGPGQNRRWAAASGAQGGQDDVASRRSRAGRGNRI